MLRPLFDRSNDVKKVGITDLGKNLSRYLKRVKRGESVLVFDRDQPVSQIISMRKVVRRIASDNARLKRLESKGLIRRGNGNAAWWLLKRRPTKVPGSVLQDLFEERRSGR